MIPAPGQDYLDKLAPLPRRTAELTLLLRTMVLEQAPGAFELVYDAPKAAAIAFSFTGKSPQAFIHLVTYDTWVALGFNQGSELPDPGRILRGDGPLIRYIRISSVGDTEREFVLRFVVEAVSRAARPAAVILTEPKPLVRGTYVRKTGVRRVKD